MQEMYGKGLFIICQEKTNFGLNMLIWKKLLAIFKSREIFLENGCNGYQGKKLGWLI
jgi:hypothetical protein